MHVGMAAVFQNPGKAQTDREVYCNELRLADLAEPLGYESIWGVEHHFTDYTMCPDVLQFLTYMAGRTQRAGLGSMVVVLPWHDPLRVAEEVSMLDNLSGGRLILGLGRGAGRVEFDGFRLSMDESRERFVESAEMLLRGLEAGYCEYDGTFVRQPRAAIRPAPFKSFRGRPYAAAVSPESMPIMARLGVGILVIPQTPWPEVAKELDAYRTTYRDINRTEAPPPVCAGWTFCDENPARAHEMARRYIGGYYQTVLDHYNFQGDHLAKTKGYEYYGKMAEKIAQYGTDKGIEYFMNLQVWGTPEQCYEKILDVRGRVGNDTFVGVFSYAGMDYGEAERHMRLFARTVTPELKQLPPAGALHEDGGGRVTLRIFDMKKPVIAAINGTAVGFGITLTLPMDVRIASTAARIGFVFTRRGVVPEACSTWFLPRLVGPSQAAEWVLTGRVFDGEEARAGGLVSRVVAPEALLPTARELALQIARNTSAVAVAPARQMLWRLLGADHPMEAHRLDSQAMFWTGRSTDAYEGVTAFLEKRPPRFTLRPSQDMPPFYPWWQPRAFT